MANGTADSIQQGANKAAQTGVKAAKTVKTAQKAAASAATGNYVGAVIQLAKDQNVRRIIIALIAIHLILVILVCILAPLAIFEGIHTLVKKADEALLNGLKSWKRDMDANSTANAQLQEYYLEMRESSSGNKLVRSFKAAVALVGKMLSDSWKKLKAEWNSSAASDGDSPVSAEEGKDYSDEDVIVDDKDMAYTYQRKITATQNTINRRINELSQDIESKSDFYQNGSSNSWLWKRFYTKFMNDPQFHQGKTFGYCNHYDQYRYDGVTLEILTKNCQPLKAVDLLCMYELLMADTPDDIMAAGYMKWLGVDDSNDIIEYPISNSGYIRRANRGSSTWRARDGGFMPKYLSKEEVDVKYDEDDPDNPYAAKDVVAFIKNCINNKTARKKYLAYKVSPVDMMIQVEGQPIASCDPIISYNVDSRHKTIWGSWSCGATEFNYDVQNNSQLCASSLDIDPMMQQMIDSGVPFYVDDGSTVTHYDGTGMVSVIVAEEPDEPPPQHDHYLSIHSVRYTYTVRIQVREVSELLKAACLYDGRLPNASLGDKQQPATPKTSINAGQHKYYIPDDSPTSPSTPSNRPGGNTPSNPSSPSNPSNPSDPRYPGSPDSQTENEYSDLSDNPIVQSAAKYIGIAKYVWGGRDIDVNGGFDCIGFVEQVFEDLGVVTNGTFGGTYWMYDTNGGGMFDEVDISNIQPGDVVMLTNYDENGNPNPRGHIGIYAGDNTVIHSAGAGQKCTRENPGTGVTTRGMNGISKVLRIKSEYMSNSSSSNYSTPATYSYY